jgi:hypothetical protein
MNVFRIIHQQTLAATSDNRITETGPEVYFQISHQAIAEGWFKKSFPGRLSGDLAVLIALGLHARPLKGNDLALMIELGQATPADEGRLYARVSDVGLADILNAHRERIRESTERLARVGLLTILSLPDKFRDSRGAFSGNHAYLLSGQNRIVSQVIERPVVRAGLSSTDDCSRAGLSGTVALTKVGRRAGLADTKLIPVALTPAGAGGPQDGPAVVSPSTPETGNEANRPTPDVSGNGQRDHRAETAAEGTSEGNSPQAQLDRLNAVLGHAQTAMAFEGLVSNIETRVGLTTAGFHAAALSLMPLPERRRRVLDDVRRMQARPDLTPAQRRSKVHAILAQNIGVTLGLGLNPDSSLRSVPVKADYAAIGGLVSAYGAEMVWQTACEVAGAAIEGDSLDYLRAALRRKQERITNGHEHPKHTGYGAGAAPGGLTGDDYIRGAIETGVMTVEQAQRDYGYTG